MVGGVDAMLECYRFGVPEGPHGEPWGPGYHREAVDVYNESLLWTYQRDIAKLFRDSLSAMAGCLIPAELASDWAIVTTYMREAADAIEHWLGTSSECRAEPPACTKQPQKDSTTSTFDIDWDG